MKKRSKKVLYEKYGPEIPYEMLSKKNSGQKLSMYWSNLKQGIRYHILSYHPFKVGAVLILFTVFVVKYQTLIKAQEDEL